RGAGSRREPPPPAPCRRYPSLAAKPQASPRNSVGGFHQEASHMDRGFLAAPVAALLALASVSPLAAAEQTVSFNSGTETAPGFLVTPEGKGPFPAVIVIQEWWGVDEWIKDQARALAKEGYVALAPDLYRGKVTNKQEEAHQLMSGLSEDRGLRDLKGAYAYLQSRPDPKTDRID